MAFFVVLQILDLLTTLLAFNRGGVELNPVVRMFMPWMGRGLAVLTCKALLVAAVWSFRNRRRVLLIGNAFYTLVVIWNVTVLFGPK